MPRNGSGVYAAPSSSFNPAVTNAEATPVDWNALLADFSTAITGSIAADGQTTISANLPMATFRHTGVGNAVARTDYASAGQVQDFSLLYAADTGAADAYAIAPTVPIAAYVVGQQFRFKVGAANLTTTPTLAVSSLATPGLIKWPDGSALAIGDLPTGAMAEVDVASIGPAVFHLQSVANFTGTGKLMKGTNPTTNTQAQADNSTKVATTAYVDRAAVQQVVSTITGALATGTTVIPTDDTIPQNTEGDQYMSLAITPKSATSKLRIDVVFYASVSAGSPAAALFQDTTANALAVGIMTSFGGGTVQFVTFSYVMTSGTTSATTFKVRAGPNTAATLTFNGAASARLYGGAFASSIVITEVGV